MRLGWSGLVWFGSLLFPLVQPSLRNLKKLGCWRSIRRRFVVFERHHSRYHPRSKSRRRMHECFSIAATRRMLHLYNHSCVVVVLLPLLLDCGAVSDYSISLSTFKLQTIVPQKFWKAHVLAYRRNRNKSPIIVLLWSSIDSSLHGLLGVVPASSPPIRTISDH